MKKERTVLLFLIVGGMELSWLHAWASFLTTSIAHQPFPFIEANVAFAAAAGLTLLSRGKGWRVISILLLQVFGFLFAGLRLVYAFHSVASPFLSQSWLIELLNTPRDPLEWFNLILILFCALFFWIRGVMLARRPMSYSSACSGFDLGLGAFFLLFLIKLLLLVKGAIEIDDPMSSFLVFPFFMLGLLAIGMIRNQTTAPGDFLPGYRGIGVILSFTLVVLLLGTGLVLFFRPYLTLTAETGYGIIKTAAKPLGPILVSILRFIFMHGAIRPDPPSPPARDLLGDMGSPVERSWWMELLEKIPGWVLGGLLGFIILMVAGVALFFLFRWLLSRTTISQRRQSTWHSILLWVDRWRIFLLSCWRGIVRKVRGTQGTIQLYAALLSWGRRSGLPHFLTETPSEYGVRLKDRFPSLKREIQLIVGVFNKEVYGEVILNEQKLSKVRLALRRLRSPIHWPSRLRSWFFQPARLPEASQYRPLDRNLMT